jgi:hypothetical protein
MSMNGIGKVAVCATTYDSETEGSDALPYR